MSYRSFKIAAAIAVGAFIAVPAFAQSGPGMHGQLYIGGSIGDPDWRTNSVNGIADGDSSGAAGRIYGGYSINKNFAIELGGQYLGKLDGSNGSAKAYGGYLDAVGLYPLNSQWSLLGRVGALETRVSANGGRDTATGWKYGAGVQYNIDTHYSVRAEAEHDILRSYDDPHVNLYTVGLNYAF